MREPETVPDLVTVKVNDELPLLPSFWVTSLMLNETSSLTIVPTPWASPIVAPAEAFDRLTLNSSSDSTYVSPQTLTVIVCVVTRAPKVSVPVALR